MMRLYLGVDGGQSSTTALIADQTGTILGCGKGGPCNHVGAGEGRAKFFEAIGSCLNEACKTAGLIAADARFASVCLGFSGGAEDKDAYSRELIRSDRYRITHDAEIALEGATAGEPGVIVIAGTGSMAFGRNAEGETARAGGWGYIFGDEGGAFFIVRQALRAALAYEEGWGSPTKLHRTLLKAAGAKSANELLHQFYADTPRSKIAAFAPIVDEAAQHHDQIARDILVEASRELARYAGCVYGHLFPSRRPVQASYVGGVFRSDLVRSVFVEAVSMSIGFEVGPPKLSPAAGALLKALRDDGIKATLSNVPESEK